MPLHNKSSFDLMTSFKNALESMGLCDSLPEADLGTGQGDIYPVERRRPGEGSAVVVGRMVLRARKVPEKWLKKLPGAVKAPGCGVRNAEE